VYSLASLRQSLDIAGVKIRSGSMDLVALSAAAAAAVATHWIFGRVLRPMPPSALVPPREGSGLLSLLGQHGYDIFVNEGLAATYRAFKKADFRAVYLRVFYFHRIIVGHPHDIAHVMIANSSNYVKGVDYKFLKATLGDGLVTLIDDDIHSTHRRIINPAFSQASLKEIADTCMRLHALEMLRNLRDEIARSAARSGTPFRAAVRTIVNRPALNIIADAAFHTGPEKVTSVAGHFQTILTAGQAAGVLNLLPFVRAFPSPAKLRRSSAMRDLSHFLREVSQTVRSSLLSQSSAVFEGKAIIDYLVHSGAFTDAQMLDHSLTFMFAGHETSSNTIQWIILLLSTSVTVQERLFEELSSVMNKDSCPEITELLKCRYLTLVVKEGMRLYPVAPIIMREAVEDDVLPYSKTVVPKGSSVTVNIFVSQRNPEIYGADADSFRPERWEDPSLSERVGSCGWMPFSVGKRNCIGKDFAINEISIIVAILIRNFCLVLPQDVKFPKRRVGITLTTREPFEVEITERLK
jgi:cytochrome P450